MTDLKSEPDQSFQTFEFGSNLSGGKANPGRYPEPRGTWYVEASAKVRLAVAVDLECSCRSWKVEGNPGAWGWARPVTIRRAS